MKKPLNLRTLAAAAALTLLVSFPALAGNVRFLILSQNDYNAKAGLYFEIGNDQKDDTVAPLKTAQIAINIADGTKWTWMGYTGKWVPKQDVVCKVTYADGKAEFWTDGKKRGSSKIKFAGFEADPDINGVPSWANGPTDYKVVLKSLKVTSEGEVWEAELDPASAEAGQATTIIKDWRFPTEPKDFTVDFTFAFDSAE